MKKPLETKLFSCKLPTATVKNLRYFLLDYDLETAETISIAINKYISDYRKNNKAAENPDREAF